MKNQFKWTALCAMLAGALGSPLQQARAQIPTITNTFALPSTAGEATKLGFIWRFHQTALAQPNSLAFTEQQLAGVKGDNIADPNAQGVALAPATPPSPPTAPMTFEIATVINLDKAAGGHGAFTPEDQMPGTPNVNNGTDNLAAEILTWLDLPAGEVTMGVNSDDGFRVTLGGAAPQDKFNHVNVGQFDGGRGAADTIFKFNVQQAGLYAARVIWENGGGDANIEWFTFLPDGTTKVLVGDKDGGGIRAYRAVTSASAKAYLKTSVPFPGSAGVAPNATIIAELVDGVAAIDPTTVKLSVGGAPVTVSPTKTAGVTLVQYTPATPFASGSQQDVSLSYTEGGNVVSQDWSFTVALLPNIPASAKVTADTSKPGFLWNIFQNDANEETSNARAAAGVAGQLLDATAGTPLPNLADPSILGAAAAAAAAANPANAPLRFEIPGVINLSQQAGSLFGAFTPDLQMPGIPAGDVDGIAAEAITYIELPAGLVTMGVNSDDGFRTTIGIGAVGTILLGEFDGGRGAADTIFYMNVLEAGVYPFRTIWQEGGGDANIEWFTLKADGAKVLVNDVANGGLKAYRAIAGTQNPYVKYVSPGTEPRQLNQVKSSVVVVIADGTNPVDDNSVALKIDGQAVTTTKARIGNLAQFTYVPTTLQIPSEIRKAELTYKDSTGSFTGTPTWQFRNLKTLILPTAKVTEDFDSYPEDTQPTGWVASNFTVKCDPPGRDITAQSSESYENWVLVSVANAPLIDGNVLNVAPGQTFNGQPVESISAGNILYAESDSRCGPNGDPGGTNWYGQTQFIITKPFDLSQVTNVVLTISVLYQQNQDSYGGIEYSVDGGNNWLPVVYYVDAVDGGGDIKYNPDGSINGVATFTAPNSDTSGWWDNGPKGGKPGGRGYGDGLAAPITAALGDYVAPRLNDNTTEAARIEVFRLAQAGKKSDVRLRLSALGTDSWWFAVDNLAFYDVPSAVQPPSDQPAFNPVVLQDGNLVISWTGTGTLEQADAVTGDWTIAPNQANPQPVSAGTGNRFYRIRQ